MDEPYKNTATVPPAITYTDAVFTPCCQLNPPKIPLLKQKNSLKARQLPAHEAKNNTKKKHKELDRVREETATAQTTADDREELRLALASPAYSSMGVDR